MGDVFIANIEINLCMNLGRHITSAKPGTRPCMRISQNSITTDVRVVIAEKGIQM
jgi:hypothetical protein